MKQIFYGTVLREAYMYSDEFAMYAGILRKYANMHCDAVAMRSSPLCKVMMTQ